MPGDRKVSWVMGGEAKEVCSNLQQRPKSNGRSSRTFFLPIGLWYQLPNKSGVNFTVQVKRKPKRLQHYPRIYESKQMECLRDFETLKCQCLSVRYMYLDSQGTFLRALQGKLGPGFSWRYFPHLCLQHQRCREVKAAGNRHLFQVSFI